MNSLIGLGLQIGVIDGYGAMPNYTKCATWADVEKSHTSAKVVELRLDNVYGLLVFWSFGIIGSLLALSVEKAVKKKLADKIH